MATANHVKALLKSHIEGDEQRFLSTALQLAANEARAGHGQLAEEIRALVDQAKTRRSVRPLLHDSAIPISRPRGELAGLLAVSYPKKRLSDMVLSPGLARQLGRIIREQRNAQRILERGLSPRRKLLLVGPPGTGKTLTASVLAGELGVPLFQVRLDGLITKFMGETAAKLRQVFDSTAQARGVYLFDEFDAIGSQRGLPNDVGEIRRVLNSFLLMIEQDESHSLIVAATNHPEVLDHALFRRFDDVLEYEPPASEQITALLRARLHEHIRGRISWTALAKKAEGLSYAEIARSVDEVLKESILNEERPITSADVGRQLSERRHSGAKVRKRVPIAR
jgi:SpoVK/Ycf46/Vps4 family AAA+-type ATPase